MSFWDKKSLPLEKLESKNSENTYDRDTGVPSFQSREEDIRSQLNSRTTIRGRFLNEHVSQEELEMKIKKQKMLREYLDQQISEKKKQKGDDPLPIMPEKSPEAPQTQKPDLPNTKKEPEFVMEPKISSPEFYEEVKEDYKPLELIEKRSVQPQINHFVKETEEEVPQNTNKRSASVQRVVTKPNQQKPPKGKAKAPVKVDHQLLRRKKSNEEFEKKMQAIEEKIQNARHKSKQMINEKMAKQKEDISRNNEMVARNKSSQKRISYEPEPEVAIPPKRGRNYEGNEQIDKGPKKPGRLSVRPLSASKQPVEAREKGRIERPRIDTGPDRPQQIRGQKPPAAITSPKGNSNDEVELPADSVLVYDIHDFLNCERDLDPFERRATKTPT